MRSIVLWDRADVLESRDECHQNYSSDRNLHWDGNSCERITLPRQMEPVGGNVVLADGDRVTGIVLVDCAVLD